MPLLTQVRGVLAAFLVSAATCVAQPAAQPTGTGLDDVIPQFMTGEALTKYCRSHLSLRRNSGRGVSNQEAYNGALCLGFVQAVFDVQIQLDRLKVQGIPAFCVPKSINSNELADAVAQFAEQNPALSSESGYILVLRAVSNHYPCSQDAK